jgi:hypothetical protein
MKRYFWLLVVAALAIGGTFAGRYLTTHEVPAGQPALVTLDAAAFADLRAEFNRHREKRRLIVLLAPT